MGSSGSMIQDSATQVLDRFSLGKKTALVVGGTRGLGQAMALALAGAGADVCVVGRGPEGLEETAEMLSALGSDAVFVSADATCEEQVVSMVEKVHSRYGKIDILLNSQGTTHLERSESFSTTEWERVVDVNVKSVFLCCKHVGQRMLERSYGKIINISSVRGFQGRAEDLAYAPSKGAVNQLTRSLAIEWGPKGINVNGIAPTFILTKISEPFIRDPAKRDWVLGRIPMNRLGDLEDLMGPVVFLASDASGFVNGHILPVDGGWLCA
jgi:NAD(P)-dependent dehydrogenase (short-subunit alcohol dehydrogenase family)